MRRILSYGVDAGPLGFVVKLPLMRIVHDGQIAVMETDMTRALLCRLCFWKQGTGGDTET